MKHKLIDITGYRCNQLTVIASHRVPEFESLSEILQHHDEKLVVFFFNRVLETTIRNQARHYDRYKEYLPGLPRPDDV